MTTRYVYEFGSTRCDGDASMKSLLGGKGANLAEMSNLGIPVPPGFTITTDVCAHAVEHDGGYPDGLDRDVEDAIASLERQLGATFDGSGTGDDMPLLLSVRSGAPISMPGMMDTVLNLGLNDRTVQQLARASGDERFAWDAYRRFIQMFADVVLGVPSEDFEHVLQDARTRAGVEHDSDLNVAQLRDVASAFHRVVREHDADHDIPDDPRQQLWLAVGAVFRSWSGDRAVIYRRHHGIADTLGTAVNVQAMVFGNAGDDCATGVAFTRDPATGANELYGEYLINAQGEDVVAGIRTPRPITRLAARQAGVDESESLEHVMPDAAQTLADIGEKLEQHFRDAQDVEFTVQHGSLWMLQTRTAKRSAAAAVRMAVEMAESGFITHDEALLRVDPASIDQLLHPSFDPTARHEVLAQGLPASPGAATGRIALDADTAVRMANDGSGEPVVLVRHETSPEDIQGMITAAGILTARGGMTSHAAVVARGLGTTCVCGCGELAIDHDTRRIRVGHGGPIMNEGDWLSIDGSSGDVIAGKVPTVPAKVEGTFETFMNWADDARRLAVRANADTPRDAQVARDFGAVGIGLCRTEHMFFDADRIHHFRRMILASTDEERGTALGVLLPMQRDDFAGILEAMAGLPVTIRLLDPPLHEFLPHTREGQAELAQRLDMRVEAVADAVENLRESNPMLGHRGVRLGVTYPGIYGMQTRAIVEAALDCRDRDIDARPEIMIPLVGTKAELAAVARHVRAVVRIVQGERGMDIDDRMFPIGTMIEVPRACVTADAIAEEAEFFSFGTNDLTQLTFGYSRDDAGVFLPAYVQRGLVPADPFQTLDTVGVGALMSMAVELGRATNPELHLGICGEHGGDPRSVRFADTLGLDYVSCSPWRVPVARVAAAHAAVLARHGDRPVDDVPLRVTRTRRARDLEPMLV